MGWPKLREGEIQVELHTTHCYYSGTILKWGSLDTAKECFNHVTV